MAKSRQSKNLVARMRELYALQELTGLPIARWFWFQWSRRAEAVSCNQKVFIRKGTLLAYVGTDGKAGSLVIPDWIRTVGANFKTPLEPQWVNQKPKIEIVKARSAGITTYIANK